MPRRVLIVDDALFMRNTLRDIFATAGFAIAGEADDVGDEPTAGTERIP